MSISVLDSKVLVLNKVYNPIRAITVKEAFCKIFTEAAEIITIENGQYASYDFSSWAEVSDYKALFESNEEDWINTTSLRLAVPRVIRLLKYDKSPKLELRLTRKNIYERDVYTCQYCNKIFSMEKLSLDHVIPRSRGGKNTWENLVCSCIECNRRKKARTPKEAGMHLLSNPYKPKSLPNFKVPQTPKRYKDWDSFISYQYWNIELKEN